MRKYSVEDIKKTLKPVDSWWTVLVIDPFVIRLTLWFANHTRLSPNLFTGTTIVTSLASGYLFSRQFLVLGAALFEVAFLLDCIDGKLALVKGVTSDVGLWLDSISDKIRLLAATLGLTIAFPHISILAIVFVGLYLWDETESALFSRMLKEETHEENELSAQTEGLPLAVRVRNSLRSRRISGPLSPVEQDTVAFFIAPLLGIPRVGFILAIGINLLGRAVSVLYFWFWRYRRQN